MPSAFSLSSTASRAEVTGCRLISRITSPGFRPALAEALPGSTSNPAVAGCYDDRWLLGKERNGGTAPAYSRSDVKGASVTLDWKASD